MGKSFASARAGMLAGQTAGLSRLTKGVPRMLTHVATLKKYGEGIPLGFLVVKGAWESAGVPTTVSGSGNDVGLFQIIISPGETLGGYSYEQLKQAGPNTAIFTKRVRAWTKSLLSKHRGWFSGPDDQALWGVEWLFGAIGSHATRHILDYIEPGTDTFNRIIKFTKFTPEWFETGTQTTGFNGRSHWGQQDPSLVTYRIMIAERIMKDVWRVDATLRGAAKAAPFLGIGFGAWLLGGVGLIGVLEWRRRGGRIRWRRGKKG